MTTQTGVSAPAEIQVKVLFDSIRVLIGGVLHLHLKQSELVGLQSWRVYGGSNYFIEYTLRGAVIRTEYDCEDKWKTILLEMGKIL